MFLTKPILSARRMSRPSSPTAIGQSVIVRYLFARGVMNKRLAVFLFVSCPLAAAMTYAQSRSATPAAPSASGLELSAIDRSADPCADFYQYACGGWIAANPIPPDRSRWGRFDELQDRNNEILHTVLEAAAGGQDPESQKIGDYYASCMDEPAIAAKGI